MSNIDCEHLQRELFDLDHNGTVIYLPGDGFYVATPSGRADASHYAPGMATLTYIGASYAYARKGLLELVVESLAV